MDKMQALRAFRSLVAAACVDGKVSQPEMQLLVRKAKEMGLEPPEVQQALQDGREGKLPFALPYEPREFRERMNEIMDVVCSDGRIESQERMLLLRFAGKAGISEADLMTRLKPKLLEAQQRLASSSAPSGRGATEDRGRPVTAAPPTVKPKTEFIEILEERARSQSEHPPAPAPRPTPKAAPTRWNKVGGGPARELDSATQATPEKRGAEPVRVRSDLLKAVEATATSIGMSTDPIQGGLTRLGPAGPVTDLGNSKAGVSPSKGPIVAPGPVTLGGSSPLTKPTNDLSPVAAMMVKAQLVHGTVEEAVRYVQTYCSVQDPVEARRLVDQIAAEIGK